MKIPYRYSDKSHSFLSKTAGLFSSEAKTLKSIEQIITSGQIEVGVVGDFDPKSLEKIFASTLGSLQPRKKKNNSELDVKEITFVKPGVTTLYYQGSDQQMAVFYCWPFSEGKDAEVEAIASLSEKIVINRMLERFREQLGLTYSPQFILQNNPAFPNFKYSCFSLQISPADEQLVHENFNTILEEFSSKPITQTELTRAREPCLLYTSPSPRDRQKSRMPSSA